MAYEGGTLDNERHGRRQQGTANPTKQKTAAEEQQQEEEHGDQTVTEQNDVKVRINPVPINKPRGADHARLLLASRLRTRPKQRKRRRKNWRRGEKRKVPRRRRNGKGMRRRPQTSCEHSWKRCGPQLE